MEIRNFIIESNDDLIRIDKFLTNELDDFSRTQVQNLIKDNNVLVNEKEVKANYILSLNDEIIVKIPDPVDIDIKKEDIPLDIYYEDDDVIVINKPSGMVVHPALGNYSGTLVNALMYHCKDLSGINGVNRAGIVHRIDKDTSGLVVCCKSDLAMKSLSHQFLEKSVDRKYIAICYGVINHNLGRIDAPLGRDPENRKRYAIVDDGKHAVTNFRVLERFKEYSLLELSLETGRTHQIRVHMKYIGHPVVGDPLYGPRNVIGDNGQYLHAQTLGFTHPRTGKRLEFTSSLPDFFNEFLESLRNNG